MYQVSPLLKSLCTGPKGSRTTLQITRSINTMMGDLKDFRSHLKQHKSLSEDKKELILTILSSAATKREARSYLAKYPLLADSTITNNITTSTSSDVEETQHRKPENKYESMIDNLLTKYSSKRSFDITAEKAEGAETYLSNVLRLALIRIKDFKSLPVPTMIGICGTIHKMRQLGVSPVIIMDVNEEIGSVPKHDVNYTTILTRNIVEQSNSMIDVFEKQSDNGLSFRSIRGLFEYDSEAKKYTVPVPEVLAIPLAQGIVPIIYPIAVETKDSNQRFMNAFDVIKTLTSELVQVNEFYHHNNENDDLITIEKVIYIDPLGGIPSLERFKSSHVYINLLQEIDDIQAELYIGFLTPEKRDIHLQNLKEMNEILTMIPNATGIITTPKIATLRKKDERLTNPIIYNILTDRPIISSSLPVNLKETPQLNTTILKKGMDIDVISSEDPSQGVDLVKESKRGNVDLDKLQNLIEDGFQRKLDMNHYLERVNGKIASLIIAGDYEGGAIITWETSTIDGETRVIPYLDKFFVLKKLQGIPGIADVIFKSLQTQYEEELLWRSRKSNPVNKWYFARSKGNMSIPDSPWRAFFSGRRKLSLIDYKMYVDICGKIEPSFL